MGVRACIVTHKDVPDETVYTFLKTIEAHVADMAKVHPSGAEYSMQFCKEGASIPLHPGAEKFFKEKGVKVTVVRLVPPTLHLTREGGASPPLSPLLQGESFMRKYRGWAAGIITAIACLMSIFQLYTGLVMTYPARYLVEAFTSVSASPSFSSSSPPAKKSPLSAARSVSLSISSLQPSPSRSATTTSTRSKTCSRDKGFRTRATS